MTTQRPLTASKIALAAALALGSAQAFAQTATEVELARRLDQLATELAAVKAQLAQIQQQRATAPEAPATPAAPKPNAQAAVVPAAPAAPAEPATVLSSYAELNYNRPTNASQNAQADVRRFVLGYQHPFDEKTKAVAELV